MEFGILNGLIYRMHRHISKEGHGIAHQKQKTIFVNDLDEDFFHSISPSRHGASPHYQALKRIDELLASSGLLCMDQACVELEVSTGELEKLLRHGYLMFYK